MRLIILLLVAALLLPLAAARDIYVDNSCQTNGNGQTTTCGANGPYNNLQSAFNVLEAGDTVYIRQGTGNYITSGQAFTIQSRSGTAQNPIRITNYPGHNPLLVNCAPNSDTASHCPHPTIFVGSSSHLIFDGLQIQGSLRMRNGLVNPTYGHLTVINSDLRTGWEGVSEGNWAPLRLEGIHTVYVANNTFRDLNIPAAGGTHTSATYIMMFAVRNVLIEYNDFQNKITQHGPGGIFDKGSADGLTIRRNRFHHAGMGYHMGGQLHGGVEMQDTLFTENIIICPQGQQSIARFGNNGINRGFTHNTGVNCRDGFGGINHGLTELNRYFYNNLAAGITGNSWEWYNDEIFGPQPGRDVWDFNIYTPGRPFHIYPTPGFNANFAQYQAHGYEPNSQAIDCGVDSQGRFSTSSPCQTAGRAGGISSGATVPVGAYAFTDCLGRGCPNADWTHPEFFGLTNLPPSTPLPVNGACGARATTYAHDVTTWPSGSTYCQSGTTSSTPSFPSQGNSVSWNCQGSNGGTTALCTATRESAPAEPEPPSIPEGTILVNEPFEDTNFASRGWYDNVNIQLDTSQAAPGSTRSARYHFAQGATTAGGTQRIRFDETETLYFSYWVKYSDNWVGSQRSYHPHEFHFVTNYDTQWVGPANSHLTFYVEQVGGTPMLFIQDNQNTDNNCVRVNSGQEFGGCNGGSFENYPFTEARSAASCNGVLGSFDGTDCYSRGGGLFYSSKSWSAAIQAFSNNQGPYYKGDWHHIEVYAEMNSIQNGVGVADGKLRYWFDGELLISTDQAFLRTGARADQAFNQLIIAPYIGDGSPVAQTLWIDNLIVATAPSSPVEEQPPQRPGDLTGDGTVRMNDILIVVENLGRTSQEEGFNPVADVNGDGIVNIFDLVLVARHFGTVYE